LVNIGLGILALMEHLTQFFHNLDPVSVMFTGASWSWQGLHQGWLHHVGGVRQGRCPPWRQVFPWM